MGVNWLYLQHGSRPSLGCVPIVTVAVKLLEGSSLLLLAACIVIHSVDQSKENKLRQLEQQKECTLDNSLHQHKQRVG